MAFNIDPNAPPLIQTTASPYGAPPDQQQQGIPAVQTRGGGGYRMLGGGNPFSSPRGGSKQQGRGYGSNELPPLDDYFKSYQLTNAKDIPSLSSADDATLATIADDYAKKFIPGALEGAYQRKADKSEVESHVAKFNMQFANRLSDFRKHLADLENKGQAPKPAEESDASKFIKQELGAGGNVSYTGGADNPLIRGLAQSGNEALSGIGYIAGHPANTVKGLWANTLPALILRRFSPELEKYIHQNSDDPTIAEWVNKHYVNPATGEPFSKESAQLETPKDATALQAATQFGSRVAGTLAQAGAGGEGAAALGAGKLGAKVAAATTYGVPAGGAAAQSMQDQGKEVDPEKMGALINTAVVSGLLPASLGGSLLKRLAVGAGIGVGANTLTNAIAGNSLTQGALGAGLIGAGFGGLHGNKSGAKAGPDTTESGAKSPAGAASLDTTKANAIPLGNDPYSQAYQGTVADPEHQVKPGTSIEEATPTMIEALDQFNARYAALHEGATPEQKAQAGAKFENDWKKQFAIAEPKADAKVNEVAAANAAAPTDAEAAQAVSENPAAGVLDKTQAAAAAGKPMPIEGMTETDVEGNVRGVTRGEPQDPAIAAGSPPVIEQPIAPGEVRQALDESAAAPGEAREAAPGPEPVSGRELVTQPGIDTRLPLGVTERVAQELRESLQRDPTPDEINNHAGMVLDEAMRQKGVDEKIPALARREAIGQLLEKNPTELPSAEDINKKAKELTGSLRGVNDAIQARIKEFEKHPAKVAERSAKEFRDVLKKARALPDTKAAGDALAEIERIKKAREEAEKAAKEKEKSDQEFRDILKKTRGMPSPEEKNNQAFRDVLKKTREMPPPKAEAASQEGEAAHSRTTDEYGHRTTGRSVDDLRQALYDKWGKKAVDFLERTGVLKLVQSQHDLERAEPGSVDPKFVTQGYYSGRNGYLVADHVPEGHEVGVLLHEIGTHYGLKRMLSPKLYESLKSYVRGKIDVDKELTDAYNKALEGNPDTRLVEEETIAHMVQAKGEVLGSIWHKAWVAMKAFVYKTIGQHLPEVARHKLLDNDVIRSLVRGATEPQGHQRYLDQPAYSRTTPSNFKTAEQISEAWNPARKATPKEVQLDKETKSKDFWTKHVNELYPLQALNRTLEKIGVKIDASKNAFLAMTNLGGQARHAINHDIANYAEPAKQKIFDIAKELGVRDEKGFQKFVGDVTNALGARHALDVNKLDYYMKVRLNDEGETARAALLQDVFNAKANPKEWYAKLKAVVNKPGAIIEKGGTRMGSGISDEKAYQLLEMARKAGITDSVAERLNAALDPIRQRTTENNLEAGNYTPEQQRIVQAYGSKWYLPFKGFAEDMSLGMDNTRRPFGAFNRDTTAAREGRQTQANNPVENLFKDLINSAKDTAYKNATKTIFKMVSDPTINKKLGGVKIKSYDINKLTNDALANGGKLSDMVSIFRDPNTVIYKNGKDWHVMQFPEGSRELEAIKTIEKDKSLGGISAVAGHATNFLARAKTSYSPVFTLWSALWRDATGYPILAALDKGPAVAGTYVKNYIGFGGPMGAWRTYANFFRGVNKFDAMEKMAKENPESFPGWAYRLSKSGGGLDFKSELNDFKKSMGLIKEIENESKNILVRGAKGALNYVKNSPVGKIGHKALEFLDALATSSIAAGRVAMFKSLVEHGMSDLEAGHYVKRMENFEQTSEGSRQLNAFFPFWRAGVANAQRMYDLVHKPNGDFDRKMFGKIMMVGAASAAAYWNFVLKQYYGDDAKNLKLTTLSKSFILPNPYGDPIEIPMGLGIPRLMLGLGMIGTRIAEGSADTSDAYEAIKQTLSENLTPLKPMEAKDNATVGDRALDLLAAVVPGALRAPYELARNQTTFGKDIHATPHYNDTRFKSDMGERSTPAEWKELAQGIHHYLGADVYPESLEYLANSYGQGYLTEMLRGFKLENKQEQGHETSLTDYPFVPRMTTGDIKYAASNKFYAEKNDLQNAVKEANALKEEGKRIPPALQKKLDEEKKFNAASREHSKAIKEIESNALLSKTAKASRLAEVNARFQRVQQQLSREVERNAQ